MTKSEAIFNLVKHIIIAVVAWVIGAIVFATLGDLGFFGIFVGFFMAGVPFGWMWLSKIFSAWSLPAIAVKLLSAIFLGWIAIFVVFIMDIIHIFTAE